VERASALAESLIRLGSDGIGVAGDCVDDIDNEMEVANLKDERERGAPAPRGSAGRVPIGKVEHFFDKIGVAAVRLKGSLKVGDTIEIEGAEGAIRQKVSSMQINRRDVSEASEGDDVGIMVNHPVHRGSLVYRIG
jgi:putative protease